MNNLILKTFLLTILFIGCKNDDDLTPIEQLPPPTTEGKNTIGCLVNGQPFTDKGIMNNFYQLVDGEYFLAINWDSPSQADYPVGQIGLFRINVEEGKTYQLNFSRRADDILTKGTAYYANINENSEFYGEYETNEMYTGEVHFTRFDEQNGIMSGTFQFQAQEITSGDVITITDGRFDLRFTN